MIHVFCAFAFTYYCAGVNYRFLGPFTRSFRLTAVVDVRAETKGPFVCVRDAAGLVTTAVYP